MGVFKNLLLVIVATLLAIVLFPLGAVWAFATYIFTMQFKKAIRSLEEYFMATAISIDQLGNTIDKELFNDLLIKKNHLPFGDTDETISSVLGKNKEARNLTTLGRWLSQLLNWLDPNHVEKSIENVQNS